MKSLERLQNECLLCKKCPIGGKHHHGSISNVFSNMNIDARIMVVGQNPGAEEVERGEPFVGASGRFFDKAVDEVLDLKRDDLYISNVVRCYTPGNRKPSWGEIENCGDFLDREVKMVQPKVMVALGAFAFKQLTGMSGIMKHCGEMVFSPRHGVFVLALLHPSPYNTNDPERREMFYKGLRTLREHLDGLDA